MFSVLMFDQQITSALRLFRGMLKVPLVFMDPRSSKDERRARRRRERGGEENEGNCVQLVSKQVVEKEGSRTLAEQLDHLPHTLCLKYS